LTIASNFGADAVAWDGPGVAPLFGEASAPGMLPPYATLAFLETTH
jgi:hypothetical protein